MTTVNTAILADSIDSIADRLHDINVALSVLEQLDRMNKNTNRRPEIVALEQELLIEQQHKLDTRMVLMSVIEDEPVIDRDPVMMTEMVKDETPFVMKTTDSYAYAKPDISIEVMYKGNEVNMLRTTENIIHSSGDAWTISSIMDNLKMITGNVFIDYRSIDRNLIRLREENSITMNDNKIIHRIQG